MSTAATTTRKIEISADGVWAGEGDLTVDSRGRHTIRCSANLPEGAYETIEDAIDNGDQTCTHEGVSYCWWLTNG
jgi:hypothetical protein